MTPVQRLMKLAEAYADIVEVPGKGTCCGFCKERVDPKAVECPGCRRTLRRTTDEVDDMPSGAANEVTESPTPSAATAHFDKTASVLSPATKGSYGFVKLARINPILRVRLAKALARKGVNRAMLEALAKKA